MERLVGWLDSLAQLELTLEVRSVLAALRADTDLLGAAVLYSFVVAWVVLSWWRRRHRSRAPASSGGIVAAEGLLRFLGALALLVLGVLLALARAEGRPPYHRW